MNKQKRVNQPKQKKPIVILPEPTPEVKQVEVPEPAPAPAPIVESKPPVVEEKPTPESDTQPQPKQTQSLESKLGIHISIARTRRHLDCKNINVAITDSIMFHKNKLDELASARSVLSNGLVRKVTRETLDDETEKETVEEVPATQADKDKANETVGSIDERHHLSYIEALSQERVRFSNEAPVVLATICNEIVRELATHAMKCTVSSGKSLVRVRHLHGDGLRELNCYPLIHSLRVFIKTRGEIEKKQHEAAAHKQLSAALAQAEKDFRKKYGVQKKKEEQPPQPTADATPKPKQEEPDPELEADDKTESKTSFKHYVHQVCKGVSGSVAEYLDVKISSEIREYLSDIVIEFIERVSTLILLTTKTLKNKTVNTASVMHTIKALLIDGHLPLHTFKDVEREIPDLLYIQSSLSDYESHRKAEIKKAKEAKKNNQTYTPVKYEKPKLDNIPLVKVQQPVYILEYPTSSFSKLESVVNGVLEKYKNI